MSINGISSSNNIVHNNTNVILSSMKVSEIEDKIDAKLAKINDNDGKTTFQDRNLLDRWCVELLEAKNLGEEINEALFNEARTYLSPNNLLYIDPAAPKKESILPDELTAAQTALECAECNAKHLPPEFLKKAQARFEIAQQTRDLGK